jgi:hypothetical protein
MPVGKAQVEAYKAAYNPDPSMPVEKIRTYARQILSHPKIKGLVEELQQGMRYQFVIMSPAAMFRLEELALNAVSEKVKLQANLEILDRGGMKPPERVEITHSGIFGEASLEDVRSILKKNLDVIEAELVEKKV